MSARLARWGPRLAAVALALASVAAEGRVGGGESFGGGGGGGGGGGFGGGGGGDGGDLIFLLIELVIRYPKVGVPLVLIFLAVVAAQSLMQHRRDSGGFVVRTGSRSPHRPAYRVRGPTPGLDRLRAADPAFSLPVFQDFVVLLHRRALDATASKSWDPLAPFVDPRGRAALNEAQSGVTAVSDVVLGTIAITSVDARGPFTQIRVALDGARLETRAGGSSRVRVRESWTLRRSATAMSLSPDAVTRMGCPSCGNAIDTDRLGACTSCGTPITAGQLQWQLVGVHVESRRPFTPPQVGWVAGGDEPSVGIPTVEAPDLAARMRALQASHPDFDVQAFSQRVRGIYLGLQDAWSAGRWEQARPWTTDTLYQSLRFWVEQYTANGLRNQLTDVRLTRLRVVRVEIDAWYEAITVRIWGSMKDAVVDGSGKVVGGNDAVDRNFSEYWTFLRAVGSGGAIHDALACPSCGAPLDRVGQAGTCGYCESVITTGRFDWVLSRIEQCEAYNGA